MVFSQTIKTAFVTNSNKCFIQLQKLSQHWLQFTAAYQFHQELHSNHITLHVLSKFC